MSSFWNGMTRPIKTIVDRLRGRNQVLVSADGAFFTAPDLAVEVAYMMSNAEAVVAEAPFEGTEVGDLLVRYLRGNMNAEEVSREMIDWLDEIRENRATRRKA